MPLHLGFQLLAGHRQPLVEVTMSPVFQGLPAAPSVEQAILLAQLQILRRVEAQRALQ
jgi:hypothetical protein